MTKLVVGLGNPGEKYKNTRHNVGFMVIDALASKVDGGQWSVVRKYNCSLYTIHRTLLLAKPQTFMNASGKAVASLSTYHHIPSTNIWVIHDDLDIRLGDYKIQYGVGPKLHYGITSIEKELGTKDFWRVRVGVDNREEGNKTPGEAYVLQNFSEDESFVLSNIIDKIVPELASLIEKDDK